MPSTDHPDAYSMSFGDHLEELRRRILWAIAVPLPLAIVIFIFSDPLIGWLYRPLDPVLASYGPGEAVRVTVFSKGRTSRLDVSLVEK